MLEGVGVEGVAEKLVSFPIILHPTNIHVEVIVAQTGACSCRKPMWKYAYRRADAHGYGEQKLVAADPHRAPFGHRRSLPFSADRKIMKASDIQECSLPGTRKKFVDFAVYTRAAQAPMLCVAQAKFNTNCQAKRRMHRREGNVEQYKKILDKCCSAIGEGTLKCCECHSAWTRTIRVEVGEGVT